MSFLWRQFDDVYTKTYIHDFPNHYVFFTIMFQGWKLWFIIEEKRGILDIHFAGVVI